jgi:hypothetical protein
MPNQSRVVCPSLWPVGNRLTQSLSIFKVVFPSLQIPLKCKGWFSDAEITIPCMFQYSSIRGYQPKFHVLQRGYGDFSVSFQSMFYLTLANVGVIHAKSALSKIPLSRNSARCGETHPQLPRVGLIQCAQRFRI